ncbi:peptidoglycan DD-metalloendopeptidase family protein [Bordetella genomosp. 11]|uniref:Peptidase n=1 Tax=Bordetella genomosp. 11 TaxID=1416808 RepID=A0A261UIK8_9BORD|nr:peptidoglycan DD-metalloendopeptidase family protein [Bordetella genomosp. 11]OZI61050.1 peptidase [Bordetella genomosp. 11]
MLDGQLQLTGTEFMGARTARSSRAMLCVGLLCLVLAGCASRTTRAPVVDLNTSTAPTAPAAAGATYVVKPGDTLYGISRANGVDIESLKRWNNIADSNHLAVGQVLKLSAPSGGAAGGAAGTKTPPTTPAKPSDTRIEPTPLPPPGEQPAQPTQQPPANNPPATSTPTPVETPKPARAADAGVINWGWPAQGQIIATFSNSTKGIDIAGNAGDPVVAAADGKVMYSGNGVRGLGNLIIVQHTNGFITAYAHNRALLVKSGAEVKKGAKIAEIGQTDAPSPRLHFEVRRQGTPVDPLQYLPPR